MPTKRMGKGATFNDNTGTFGTPTWRAHKWVRDITRNEEPYVIDATDRFVDYDLSLASRFKLSYDIDGIWQANTSQTLLRTNFLAGTALDLAVLDRISVVTVGSNGLGHRGEMLITKFSLEFPLNGEQKLSCSVMPYGSHTASQGVVTYTDTSVTLGTADAPGTRKLGKDASINDGSDTPLTGIRDWKLNMEWGTADASDRASDFDLFNVTQMGISIEADFAWDTADATLTALRTAYNAHTILEDYKFLDGAFVTVGSWGPVLDVEITKMNWKGELRGLQMYSVEFKPRSNYTTAPTFTTIT